MSPVMEFAIADILLLAGATGVFLVVRSTAEEKGVLNVLLWTLCLLLLANLAVIYRQITDSNFTPIFSSRPANFPSGFFGHYNDSANFLVGASFLLGGMALLAQGPKINRCLWGLIAICGLAAIPFTHSRGGILAAAVGAATLFSLFLILGYRRKAKWLLPLLIALPLFSIAAGWYLLAGWHSAQEIRSADAAVTDVLDNSIRLHLISIAASTIGLHPLAGGGSRSYSWECNYFWNILDYGWVKSRPEMVHNEFLQSITDYGLIGGALIAILIIVSFLKVLNQIILSPDSQIGSTKTAMRFSGAAALTAILTQSSFSFVFHLLPGVLILGVCLAFMSHSSAKGDHRSFRWPLSWICVTVIGIMTGAVSIIYGWKGSKVSGILSPLYTSRQVFTPSERSDLLARAIEVWPQASLYRERALINHGIILKSSDEEISPKLSEEVVSNYRNALALNPYDIISSINLANFLSHLDRDDQASAEYQRAIQLQGGFELAYKGHLKLSGHLLKVAAGQLDRGDPGPAMENLAKAAHEFDESAKGIPSLPFDAEGIALKYSIHESLAIAQENSGDIDEALSAYNKLAEMGATRGHYRAALLLGNLGKTAWSERRPSEALTRFQEARQRMELASELPAGVTPEMKAEYITFLDRSIKYLVEAKVEPLKKSEE